MDDRQRYFFYIGRLGNVVSQAVRSVVHRPSGRCWVKFAVWLDRIANRPSKGFRWQMFDAARGVGLAVAARQKRTFLRSIR